MIAGEPILDDEADAERFDLPVGQSFARVTDGPDGRWQLLLSAILTKSTLPGVHQYEVDFISPDGVVSTYCAGEFTVDKDLA